MNTVRIASATLLLSALVGISATLPAHADDAPQQPTVVMDGADLFTDNEESSLVQVIERNSENYDLHFVVETIPSLGGEKLETFSLQRANELGVGEADKDNGVFILVSRDDRVVRFELGGGVTETVSDDEMTGIINSVVTPSFKSGAYKDGVEAGMTAVGAEHVGIVPAQKGYNPLFFGMLLLVGLALIFPIVLLVRWIRRAVGERAANRAKNRATKCHAIVKEFVQTLKASPLESDEYKNLSNEAARLAWLKKNHPDVAKALKVVSNEKKPSTELIDKPLFTPIDAGGHHFISVLRRGSIALSSWALIGSTTFYNQVSINTANANIEAANRAGQKALDEESVEDKKKREGAAEAKKIWRKLSQNARRKMRQAKTEAEQKRLLADATGSSAYFPLVHSLFLGENSSNLGSSGSTHRSSSSSSSSYSSSDYSSGSFGGGSFDGGGGSGSW